MGSSIFCLKFVRNCVEIYADGSIFKGLYSDGNKEGKGKC